MTPVLFTQTCTRQRGSHRGGPNYIWSIKTIVLVQFECFSLSYISFVSDLIEVELVKSKSTERCKFWPACRLADKCTFYHPTKPCKWVNLLVVALIYCRQHFCITGVFDSQQEKNISSCTQNCLSSLFLSWIASLFCLVEKLITFVFAVFKQRL